MEWWWHSKAYLIVTYRDEQNTENTENEENDQVEDVDVERTMCRVCNVLKKK